MTKSLPIIKYLSARVTWRDNKWNGKFCFNVIVNSFCHILALIDEVMKPEDEPEFNDVNLDYKNPNHALLRLPAKGMFMSLPEYVRATKHAWQKKNNQLLKDFLPGRCVHRHYSYNDVEINNNL